MHDRKVRVSAGLSASRREDGMAEEEVYLDDVLKGIEAELVERDAQLVGIGLLLGEMVADQEKLLDWLTSPNDGFDGERPIDLLKGAEGTARLYGTLLLLGEGGSF
jgi:uncharacterized protein (DUF2384 family)